MTGTNCPWCGGPNLPMDTGKPHPLIMGATIAVLVCVAQCYMDPHKKGQYR